VKPGPPVPSPPGALVLTLGATALLWFALGLLGPDTGPTLALAVGTTLGFGVIGTLAARAVPPPADQRLGLRRPPWRAFAWVLLLVPALILLSELDNGIAARLERPAAATAGGLEGTSAETPPAGAETAPPAAPVPDPRDPLTLVEWALFAALLRPVLEEFFFRGVVQQGMVQAFGLGRGVLATALLFAAVRSTFGVGSAYTATTLASQGLVEGLVLGLLRAASGSLLPGIAWAAATSGLGIAAVAASDAVPIPGFNAEGSHTPPEWVALCALPVALGVGLAWRAARAAPPLPPVPPAPPVLRA